MEQFLIPAQQKLIDLAPDIKMVFVSIADVRIVPPAFKQQVLKMLKGIANKNARKEVEYFNSSRGVAFKATELFLIPDWDGKILEKGSWSDANWTFRVSIIHDNIVRGCVQSSTREVGKTYLEIVQKLLASSPSLRLRAPGFKELNEDVIAPGCEFFHRVEISEECCLLYYEFFVEGRDIRFRVELEGKEAEGPTILRPEALVRAPKLSERGSLCATKGVYRFCWSNKHSNFQGRTLTWAVGVISSDGRSPAVGTC